MNKAKQVKAAPLIEIGVRRNGKWEIVFSHTDIREIGHYVGKEISYSELKNDPTAQVVMNAGGNGIITIWDSKWDWKPNL